jgi:4-amino-4-deoxy-L-arabinose transferase-like glycosyltransferase
LWADAWRCLALVALVIAAWGLRVPTEWGTSDSAAYQVLALSLATNGEYASSVGLEKTAISHYPPLTPALTAAGFLLFGVHPWTPGLVALLLGATAAIAVYFLARMLFRERNLAVLAAAWFAVLPTTGLLVSRTNSECPYVILLVAAALAYRRAARRSFSVGSLALVGVVVGLLPLCRMPGLTALLALFLLGLVAAYVWRSWKPFWAHLPAVAIASAPAVAWSVRNAARSAAETTAAGAASDTVLGGTAFWARTFLLKDPYDPEMGFASAWDMVLRIAERFVGFVPEIGVPTAYGTVALGCIVVGAASYAVFTRCLRSRRTGTGDERLAPILFLAISGCLYIAVHLVYGYTDYTRFALPYSSLSVVAFVWLVTAFGGAPRPASTIAIAVTALAATVDLGILGWIDRTHAARMLAFGFTYLLVALSIVRARSDLPRFLTGKALLSLYVIVLAASGSLASLKANRRGEPAALIEYRQAFQALTDTLPPGALVVARKPNLAHLESQRRLRIVRHPNTRSDERFRTFLLRHRPRCIVSSRLGHSDVRRFLQPYLARHTATLPVVKQFGGTMLHAVDLERLG